jgi:hypothetical protein
VLSSIKVFTQHLRDIFKPNGSSSNAFSLAAKEKELRRKATSKICQCYIRRLKAIKKFLPI